MTQGVQSDLDAIAALPAVPMILDSVCGLTGLGFAAISRIIDGRWIAGAVRDDIGLGLTPGSELGLAATLCDQVHTSRAPIAIDHVAVNPAYRDHPFPAMHRFQSYVSMPIILPTGEFFGTLCAAGRDPAEVERPAILHALTLFAELIAHQVDANHQAHRLQAALLDLRQAAGEREIAADRELRQAQILLRNERITGRLRQIDTGRQLRSARTALMDEQKTAELRDMFIAILGHDLRNPLAALSAGLRLIDQTPLNERAARIVPMMQQSVERMTEMVANVLDFARGRLIGGIELSRSSAEPLAPVLRQVINEQRISRRGLAIVEHISVAEPIDCDHDRIAQMLSNMLSNALIHGAQDQPVVVTAAGEGGRFRLSVSNGGPEIPAHLRERIFEAFNDTREPGRRRGLGLGLYIAAEIARAHGGQLTVTSADGQTSFTFDMPNPAADAALRTMRAS